MFCGLETSFCLNYTLHYNLNYNLNIPLTILFLLLATLGFLGLGIGGRIHCMALGEKKSHKKVTNFQDGWKILMIGKRFSQ